MKGDFNAAAATQADWDRCPGLRDETTKVAATMKNRGGPFVRRLGEALEHANAQEAVKARLAYPEYWHYFLKSGCE